MKVSVLSTGTEITNGQTINRNSSWISSQLKTKGIDVELHLAVPDHREKILKSLDFCAAQSDLVFITGGLGPTTDDFTREVVSKWLQKDLVFSQPSWERITKYLEQKGIQPRENQKQQCYFPQDATVLSNSIGTADGFLCEKFHQFSESDKRKVTIIVLPGPPREIESIWKDNLNSWLDQKTKHIDRSITQSWDTMGAPESEIDETVWKALHEMKKDFPIDVGFREHLPYIEVKLTYPQSVEFTAQIFVDKVTQALKPFTVLRNFEKADQLFMQVIKDQSFTFYDFSTQGALHQSLSTSLNQSKDWMWKQSNEPMDLDFFKEETNFLALIPLTEEQQTLLTFNINNQTHDVLLKTPERFNKMKERRFKYIAESALIEFVKRARK